MKKYLKFHLVYFLNRMVVLTAVAVSIFTLIVFVTIAIINKNNNYYNDVYFDSTLLFLKIITISLACFLFGESFWIDKDQYRFFLIDSRKKRFIYILTKILTIMFVLLIFYLIDVMFLLGVGILFKNDFSVNINQINSYMWVYCIGILYGMYSSLLTIIIQNSFMMMIPFLLFLTMEGLTSFNNESLVSITSILLPNIHNDKGIYLLPYGIVHILVLSIIILTINVFIYYMKDLK